MLPLIGLDNLLAQGVLSTAANPATVQNLIDGLTYDYWMPNSGSSHSVTVSLGEARQANYLAIAGHNLGDVGGLIGAGFANGGGYTGALFQFPVTSNAPLLVPFSGIHSGSEWRLYVDAPAPYRIAVAHIGLMTELQRGMPLTWTPPLRSNEAVERANSFTVGGQVLGTNIVRQNMTTTVPQNNATRTWVDAVWEPMVAQMQLAPFFFRWSTDHAECVYGSLGSSNSSYVSADLLNVSLTMEGLVR